MKFFLFRKEEITDNSSSASDTGVGLSVLAIPVKHVSFLTASKGAVIIMFNDTGLYEDINLFDSEAIEKTSVTVSCSVGEELGLLENIMNFISNSNKNVIKFDVVSENSTFKKAVLSKAEGIVAKVKVKPISITTGDISEGPLDVAYQGSIAGIVFGENNLPSLDFNHEGLEGYGSGVEVTSWSNAGTSKSTNSIVANVGAPLHVVAESSFSKLSKSSVRLVTADYFTIPNAYTVQEDYTLYAAFTPSSLSDGLGVLYGDADGQTAGFSFASTVLDTNGDIGKIGSKPSTLSIRHDDRSGIPATAGTNSSIKGTTDYVFPENMDSDTNEVSCHVFIIRRDKNSNIYLHNRTGDLVSFIPAFTIKDTISGKLTTSASMTDGNLLIEQLGTTGGAVAATGLSRTFNGYLCRFGVIERDIGSNASSNLAQSLYKLYKL